MKIFHSGSCCLFALVVLLPSCSLHQRQCKERHLRKNSIAVKFTGEKQSSVAEDKNSLQPIDSGIINITASLRGGDVLMPAKEPCLKIFADTDSHE